MKFNLSLGSENSNLQTLIDCQNKLKLKNRYSVFIFCAGSGKRMGSAIPKPLTAVKYPDGSSTILENTINNLSMISAISNIYVLVSSEFIGHYENFQKDNVLIVQISSSNLTGTFPTAKAIPKCLLRNHNAIFIWGDLASWSWKVLETSMMYMETGNYGAVVPTRLRRNPYVAFVRDSSGDIIQVIHSRYHEPFVGVAEQDASIFIFSSSMVDEILNTKSKHEFDDDLLFHLVGFGFSEKISFIPIVSSQLHGGINTLNQLNELNSKLSRINKADYKFFREGLL